MSNLTRWEPVRELRLFSACIIGAEKTESTIRFSRPASRNG